MIENKKTLVFTGGHHTSSLVVAKQLSQQGWQIVWFGHRHSMWGDVSDSAEFKEVSLAGFEFFDLKAGKLFHTFNPVKLLRVPIGFIQAFYLLLIIKLKVRDFSLGIVSFGGYLAVPTVICGWLLHIPSLTHEQTVVRGWANHILSYFVKVIALTWASSQRFYPTGKSVVTGLPLRPEIFSLSGHQNKPPVIYITGGKQGSHLINNLIFSSLPGLIKSYQVIHQTGSSTLTNDYSVALDLAKKYPSYTVFDFDSDQALKALASADIVISRAGAHTVYELALLQKRCILIPIPWVSHQEQLQNARLLEANHQAIILPQSELLTEKLYISLREIMKLVPGKMSVPRDGLVRLVKLIESTFA